jgi:hypothetical protein
MPINLPQRHGAHRGNAWSHDGSANAHVGAESIRWASVGDFFVFFVSFVVS